MTVARPVAAFTTATAAGIAENTFSDSKDENTVPADLTCPIDACCDGQDCPPEEHRKHHTFKQKVIAGLKYALTDVWHDMAGWFMIGILLAGLITALVPDEIMVRFLGGGLSSMFLMLLVGIPLYICATASTPRCRSAHFKGCQPGRSASLSAGRPGHQHNIVDSPVGGLSGNAPPPSIWGPFASLRFFSVSWWITFTMPSVWYPRHCWAGHLKSYRHGHNGPAPFFYWPCRLSRSLQAFHPDSKAVGSKRKQKQNLMLHPRCPIARRRHEDVRKDVYRLFSKSF